MNRGRDDGPTATRESSLTMYSRQYPQAKKGWPLWVRLPIWCVVIVWGIGMVGSVGMKGFVGKHGGAVPSQAYAKMQSLELLLWARQKIEGRFPSEEEGLVSLFLSRKNNSDADQERAKSKIKDPWGRNFQYRMPGIHRPDSYDLYSFGPDGIEGTEDDVNNWTEPAPATGPREGPGAGLSLPGLK